MYKSKHKKYLTLAICWPNIGVVTRVPFDQYILILDLCVIPITRSIAKKVSISALSFDFCLFTNGYDLKLFLSLNVLLCIYFWLPHKAMNNFIINVKFE